jgi:hypothetical protein
LKTFGIVDAEGKPTERAEKWRHDDTYPEVCEEIKRDVYPEELLHTAADPQERAAAERWFARTTKAGTAHVKKLGGLYQVIMEADPTKRRDVGKGGRSSSQPTERAGTGKPKSAPKRSQSAVSVVGDGDNAEASAAIGPQAPSVPVVAQLPTPALHFDIQIHIDPNASAEQIDRIFASMAKHLKVLYQPDAQ